MSQWSWIRRFFLSIEVQPNGCWLWRSFRSRLGYAHFNINNRTVSAHRWLYEAMCGKVAPGLELDHLCRARACVNPLHLEPVTHRENIRRGSRGSTYPIGYCRHGHALSETIRNGKRHSWCGTCRTTHRKAYYLANRDSIIARVKANQARAGQ